MQFEARSLQIVNQSDLTVLRSLGEPTNQSLLWGESAVSSLARVRHANGCTSQIFSYVAEGCLFCTNLNLFHSENWISDVFSTFCKKWMIPFLLVALNSIRFLLVKLSVARARRMAPALLERLCWMHFFYSSKNAALNLCSRTRTYLDLWRNVSIKSFIGHRNHFISTTCMVRGKVAQGQSIINLVCWSTSLAWHDLDASDDQ